MARRQSQMPTLALGAGFTPTPKQSEFLRLTTRWSTFASAARVGKTVAMVQKALQRIAHDVANKPGRPQSGTGSSRRFGWSYWFLAPTANLTREMQRNVMGAIPPSWIEQWREGDQQLILRGGVSLAFKSTERPELLVAEGICGVVWDECARSVGDAWRGQVRMRLADRMGWGIFATTPTSTSSWVYTDLVTPALSGDPDYGLVTGRTVDNPYVPVAEIEQAKRSLPERYWAREYGGSWTSFIGLVYEWDSRIHVTTEAELRLKHRVGTQSPRILFKRICAGVDWGFTAPGAIVVIGEMADGSLVIVEEAYRKNVPIFEGRDQALSWVGIARELREKWGISQFYCDQARPDAIFDFVRAGLPATGAENDIAAGVRRVSEWLHPVSGVPRMVVLDTCRNVIRELGEYSYGTDRQGNQTDAPAPGQSDHAADAVRYAVVEMTRYASADPKRAPTGQTFAVRPGLYVTR